MRHPVLLLMAAIGCGQEAEPTTPTAEPVGEQDQTPNARSAGNQVASPSVDGLVEKAPAVKPLDEVEPTNRLPADSWLRVAGKQIRTSPGAVYYPADRVFLGMGVAHPRTSQLSYGSDEPVARFARERHCRGWFLAGPGAGQGKCRQRNDAHDRSREDAICPPAHHGLRSDRRSHRQNLRV